MTQVNKTIFVIPLTGDLHVHPMSILHWDAGMKRDMKVDLATPKHISIYNRVTYAFVDCIECHMVQAVLYNCSHNI